MLSRDGGYHVVTRRYVDTLNGTEARGWMVILSTDDETKAIASFDETCAEQVRLRSQEFIAPRSFRDPAKIIGAIRSLGVYARSARAPIEDQTLHSVLWMQVYRRLQLDGAKAKNTWPWPNSFSHPALPLGEDAWEHFHDLVNRPIEVDRIRPRQQAFALEHEMTAARPKRDGPEPPTPAGGL